MFLLAHTKLLMTLLQVRGNNSCTENLLETWSDPIVVKQVVNSSSTEEVDESDESDESKLIFIYIYTF